MKQRKQQPLLGRIFPLCTKGGPEAWLPKENDRFLNSMSKCQGPPDQTFLEGDILNHLEGCVEGDHASKDWTFIIKPGCIATVFDREVFSPQNYTNLLPGSTLFGVK